MSAAWQTRAGLLLLACLCRQDAMTSLLLCTAVMPLYPLQ